MSTELNRKLTRRQMLKLAAAGAAGLAVAACAPQVTAIPQVVERTVQVEVTKEVEITKEVQVTQQVTIVETPTIPPKGTVTLEFWQPFGDLNKNAVEQLVKQWNGTNTDIQIKLEYEPSVTSAGTNPKFLAAALSGNPPDLIIHDGSSFSTSTVLNAFTVLDDLISMTKLDPTVYYPWAWQKCQWAGHTYGLPLNTDARALYSNTKMLQDAGIDKPPATIDELDAMVDKLTKKKGDRFDVMGFIPWAGNWFLIGWGWDWGVNVYDDTAHKIHLNAPEMVAALEWEVTYAKKYGINQMESFVQGFGGGAQDPFVLGLEALTIDGDWAIANINQYKPDLDYQITPPPYPSGKSAETWSGGFVVGIPTGGKHIEESWKFLSWFTAVDANSTFAKIGGSLPTNMAAAQKVYANDPRHKIFLDLLPVSHIEPVIPEWSLAWDSHLAAEQDALYGRKPAQQALDEANQKVQDAIDARLSGA
ncbi:MAG: ABC transporter substrate-binding protein [Anaerolineaceae bacterium]